MCASLAAPWDWNSVERGQEERLELRSFGQPSSTVAEQTDEGGSGSIRETSNEQTAHQQDNTLACQLTSRVRSIVIQVVWC